MEGSSNGLKKGTWTFEEDSLLRKCIDKYGEGKWHQVPLRAGLNRCRKSCRLRWLNYLKPTIKKGKLSSDEVDLVLRMHKLLGNRWSLIAGRLPNRTANDIKNYWNTHLSKECEPSFKAKVKKRNIVITKKIDVLKPRARSFFVNNGCSHLKGIPEADFITQCTVLNNNINVCENNNKEKENNEIVNSLMDGENMWWESFLEESQDAYPVNPEATKTEEGATSAIHVEQFWSFLDGETEELI